MRTTLSECQAALEAENGFLLQKWKSGQADAQSEELWRGRDRQGTTAQAHQRPATVARRSTDPTLASTELRCLSPCPCCREEPPYHEATGQFIAMSTAGKLLLQSLVSSAAENSNPIEGES